MFEMNVEHIKPVPSQETIVMIHGLQSSLRTFDKLIPLLPKTMEVFRVDQRGHGETKAWGNSYTSEEMAKDLHHKIHQTNIGTPFHLLGHSMGGRTALAYAGLYPEDVKSIIIEDMGMERRAGLDEEKLVRLQNIYADFKYHTLEFDSIEEIRQILKPLFSYYDGLIKSKVIQLPSGKYKLQFNPGVAALYGYQGNYSDLSWGLDNNIPVTFFVADSKIGSAMNDKSLDYIRQKTPRAKIEYFEGAWHNIHKSQTEKFTKKLLNWINKF